MTDTSADLFNIQSEPSETPRDAAVRAATLRSDIHIEKFLNQRTHGSDDATFAQNVNALPQLTPEQQQYAINKSAEIADKVRLMQLASSEYEGLREAQRYTKKPIVKDDFTHGFIADAGKVEGLYKEALKHFPGVEEAFHYQLHAALDGIKPNINASKHPHGFHNVVVDALPKPIAHMGRHTRVLHYGHPVPTDQQSLWADDVVQNRSYSAVTSR